MAPTTMPPPNVCPDRRRTVFGTLKSTQAFHIGLGYFHHHEFVDLNKLSGEEEEEAAENDNDHPIKLRKNQIRHRLVRKDMGFMRRTHSFYADDDNFSVPKSSNLFMSSRRRLGK